MRTLLITLIATAAHAQTFYVKDATGVYKSEFPGPWVQVITFESGDRWVDLTGTTPDEPKDPPTDATFVTRVKSISASTLKENEARALVEVLKLFQRPNADLSKAEQGLTSAIDVLASSRFFPDNQFKTWLAQVKAIGGLQYNRALFVTLGQAVADQFSLSGEPISIVEIIQLIQLIFELLKNLGIFGAQATYAVSTTVDWRPLYALLADRVLS